MRYQGRRGSRCDDGCGLARGADRRADQQRRRDVHRADRADVVPRGGCDPGADAAWHDVLHARRRQALDRRQTQRRGAEYSFDVDHYRPRLHGAVGDGEVGRSGDDQKPGGGVGTQGRPPGGDRARRVSNSGCIGPASARRPRPELGIAESARPRRRTKRAGQPCELSDFGFRRLHQRRDGGAGWRRASAQFRGRGSAAVDRRAMGKTARRRAKGNS